jgi:uncharacterized protein YjhX (UPF0386 family)
MHNRVVDMPLVAALKQKQLIANHSGALDIKFRERSMEWTQKGPHIQFLREPADRTTGIKCNKNPAPAIYP